MRTFMRHSGLTYHSARCALNVDIFQQINKLRVSPDASFRFWEGAKAPSINKRKTA